jgi:sporulation protein YabP
MRENMEDLNGISRMHKVTMTNRKNCSLNGINDVLSFDIHEILLETEQGMLMIKGDELHVSRLTLDKGEVDIEGRVDSLTYSDAGLAGQKGESLLSRLFR